MKELINPQTKMIPNWERWDKIVEELQKMTKSKFPKNWTMYKDKWNFLHSDYKKIVDYHKWTNHHTYF